MVHHPGKQPARDELDQPTSARRVAVRQKPFTKDILREELPRHFRPPHIPEYNDSSDLEDHFGIVFLAPKSNKIFSNQLVWDY